MSNFKENFFCFGIVVLVSIIFGYVIENEIIIRKETYSNLKNIGKFFSELIHILFVFFR
jgi:hypothetical protein